MNDTDKFKIEMSSTVDLAYDAQVLKREIDELSVAIRHYGKEHPEYKKWFAAKSQKMRIRKRILDCIKNRQLRLL